MRVFPVDVDAEGLHPTETNRRQVAAATRYSDIAKVGAGTALLRRAGRRRSDRGAGACDETAVRSSHIVHPTLHKQIG